MNRWTTHGAEYVALLERMQTVAKENGFVLNPDAERIEKVLGLMTENLVAAGKPYCPCKQNHPLDPSRDQTCTCREWTDEIAADGHCFCRLFYAGGGS